MVHFEVIATYCIKYRLSFIILFWDIQYLFKCYWIAFAALWKCVLQHWCGPFWTLFCFIDLCAYLSAVPRGLGHYSLWQTLHSSTVGFSISISFFQHCFDDASSLAFLQRNSESLNGIVLPWVPTDSFTLLSLSVHKYSLCLMRLGHLWCLSSVFVVVSML